MKIHTVASLLVLCSSLPSSPAQKHSQPAAFHLKLVRSIDLHKPKGAVDQLVELPGGGFIVRDSETPDFKNQAVEIYKTTGTLERKIGSYGLAPGRYRALMDVVFSTRTNSIWLVDGMGRLSLFDLNGNLLDSVMLQKPGFHPYSIAFDQRRGHYYVTGCVALHFYLDMGCTMIHEYDTNTKTFLGSFAENDRNAVANKYFALENYKLDVTSSAIYAIDAPIRKLWIISPDHKIESHPIVSKVIRDIPVIDPSKPGPEIGRGQWLFDKIIASQRAVVISASLKGEDKYLLEIYTPKGESIASDITPPGRLIGRSPRGTLWFGYRNGAIFRLEEYSY
jgi:hypothetical protein